MGFQIGDEMAGIQLGDARLNARAVAVLEGLAADAQASVNGSFHTWKETHAAYRFFQNAKVTPEKILEPHRRATCQRIAEQPVVLLVQDTTELDLTDHPPEGAGPMTSEDRLGFQDHSHLAFTPDRLCLGVVAANVYARSGEGFGDSKQRQHNPIETKETYRWLEGYRLACEIQAASPQTQIVSIADCEADIYELFVEAHQHETPADFVIRVGKNRSLPELNPDAEGQTYRKLRDEIQAAPVVAIRDVELPYTPKREARTARLEIRAQRITLKAPYRKHAKLPNVEVNVVRVTEVDPPDDGTAVDWLLATSLPIDTLDEVLTVVDFYAARWPIEIFFRVLKTGCRVEEIQLETADRFLPCLMMYKIVAWRILYLTHMGRASPELPCDVIFEDHEWKPVWRIVRDEPLPDSPPRLDDFLTMVAQLDGYNDRKTDRPPGPQSLWIGFRRMHDFAIAWRAFAPDSEKRNGCV